MAQMSTDVPFRLGFFNTVAEADSAIRNLRAAGIPMQEIAVLCPQEFKNQLSPDVPQAERPGSHAAAAIVEGGAVGAALGGVALVATALATGGIGLLPAIPVFLGGGALAGGFSSLIMADGYGKDLGEYYEEAVRLGKIAVGVHCYGEDSAAKLAKAQRILQEAGAASATREQFAVNQP
jgi:hypothetical protein